MLGSRGSQRDLNVGNLLKGRMRTGVAGAGSAELPSYRRVGEPTPTARNVQVSPLLVARVDGHVVAGTVRIAVECLG